MQSIADGSYLVSSSLSNSPLLTVQPLQGFPDTLHLQLSHFLAQKSSMAPQCAPRQVQTVSLGMQGPSATEPSPPPQARLPRSSSSRSPSLQPNSCPQSPSSLPHSNLQTFPVLSFTVDLVLPILSSRIFLTLRIPCHIPPPLGILLEVNR